MISLRRIAALVRKEIRQLRRDHLTVGMVAVIPLALLVLFGYAINTEVRHLKAAIADQSGTQLSRILTADAQASQVIRIVARVRTAEELETLLRTGRISVGLYIPRDFARRVQTPGLPAAQLLINGTDPLILTAARQLTDMVLRHAVDHPAATRTSLFEIRNYYNPERRSAVHIVPGLIGVILTSTMVMFTAVAIVREREWGNLELLINTPVKNLELMFGKTLPYTLIGLAQVTLIMVIGLLLFHVPVSGSMVDLYIAALAFIVANLTLGLVISTLVQTQFQAMQAAFFFLLPTTLLSGFMFPYDGMPLPAQCFSELLPLTHFARLSRGILLRGATLAELWREVAALLLFMSVMLSVAVLRFRKRLD